jgi:hypothetical protein
MSEYKVAPLDFSNLRTVPLAGRPGKVNLGHFGRPYQGQPSGSMTAFVDSLPHLLGADQLRGLAAAMIGARKAERAILWGIGGHVVKCGLAPVLIDLMDRGLLTALAMNGAAAIHDLEIALSGATSEEVDEVLTDGRFGAADETAATFHGAAVLAAREGIGLGEALGRGLVAAPNAAVSLLTAAWSRKIPVTVHVALGTDTPHNDPRMDAAALGSASYHDFRLFASLVRGLEGGGVYLNVGSAVLLPEVFLKAVSVARNLGHPLREFNTANLDFIQHYRPTRNVVERPVAAGGGRGFALTGHHEIMLPLLAAYLGEQPT